MTKDQEREALQKIVDIINAAGPGSYIAAAFEGCADIARENIDNDWLTSPKVQKETLQRDLENARRNAENLAESVACRDIMLSEKDKKYVSAVESYNRESERAIKHLNMYQEQEEKAAALESEIITLKAKLYDLMTK